MTDRYAGFVVTLASDTRDDDAAEILTALRMVKGVIGVEPITAGHELHIAEARADDRWRARLVTLLDPGTDVKR